MKKTNKKQKTKLKHKTIPKKINKSIKNVKKVYISPIFFRLMYLIFTLYLHSRSKEKFFFNYETKKKKKVFYIC
uniref:Uncharacterized protein n=1 Tax=Lepeophtheirus salmonis TaxID=72036 RepID=A0A0K2T1J0_LEPSM